MVPPRPGPHLGISQPGLALTPLQAALHPMLGLGYSRQHPRQRLRRGAGEVVIVPGRPALVGAPDHHQQFLRTDPPPVCLRHHARRDQLYELWATLPIADLDPSPRPRWSRLGPGPDLL